VVMEGGGEEEVVLTFTVKGGEVAVKQIKQVEKATDKLDNTTKKSADSSGDAWKRYAKAVGGAMADVTKALASTELAQNVFSVAVLAGLGAGAAAYRTGGVGLAAAALVAAKTAAKTFKFALITGPGGLASTMMQARGLIGAGGGLSMLAAGGLGLAATAAKGYGGLAGTAAGVGLGALGKSIGTLGFTGTALAAGAVAAPILGAAKLLQWGAGGMEGASDQIEYRNRVDALLGGGASERQLGTVDPARQLGMTKTSYLQGFGGLTAQLMGAGMESGQASGKAAGLVQLAADLGSFNNLTTEESTQAIQAGLRGENEMLERAGIFLNQKTIDVHAQRLFGKNAAELDPAQAAQARLAAIEGSTGAAQAKGDFLRSLPTSLEGQKKVAEARLADAQEKLGASLNKILLAVMPLAAPLLDLLDFMVGVMQPVLDLIAVVLRELVDFLTLEIFTAENVRAGAVGMRTQFTGKTPEELAAIDAQRRADRAAELAAGVGVAKEVGSALETSLTGPYGDLLGIGGKATGGMVPGWSPGIDNMLVPLSGGEGVLVPEAVQLMGGPQAVDKANMLGLRNRGRGYANGVGAAQRSAALVGGGEKYRVLGEITGIFAPGGGMPGAPADRMPGATTSTPGSGGTWSSDAFLALTTRILLEKGLDPSYANDILQQAIRESSLNPNAINDWDSNAQKGTPSQGILQFIRPTFDEYHEAGWNNWMGVEDQIRALLNYVPARYGSLDHLRENAYGAYDAGGWLPPGVMQTVNKTGEPEAVLTSDQWKDIRQLAGVGGGGGGGVTVHIGSIVVDTGGDDMASTIVDKLGQAIAVRINRANDRRL